MKQTNYFNTTSLQSRELKTEKKEKHTQTEEILNIFRAYPKKEFTPFDILNLLNTNAPITSIRRAITDLTTLNYLEKCNTQKLGDYGKKNYLWKVKQIQPEPVQLFLFD